MPKSTAEESHGSRAENWSQSIDISTDHHLQLRKPRVKGVQKPPPGDVTGGRQTVNPSVMTLGCKISINQLLVSFMKICLDHEDPDIIKGSIH